MSTDDILKFVPSPGGGIEVRFDLNKLSNLSVDQRHELARKIVESPAASPTVTTTETAS
jgi:hypothetical protein